MFKSNLHDSRRGGGRKHLPSTHNRRLKQFNDERTLCDCPMQDILDSKLPEKYLFLGYRKELMAN